MTTYRITKKQKTLKGSKTDDFFFGSKFKDNFDGRDGDDYIYGGDGSDNLTGGDGNDAIYGGLGSDKALGGLGNDDLYGSLGNDKLYGGVGKDFLIGDEGNDALYGELGNDVLNGGEGNDKLYGGDENDDLSGHEGNDRLDGGKGDDDLIGGAGNDYLSGGDGDDFLDGTDPIPSTDPTIPYVSSKDRLLGGNGNDTVIVDVGDNAIGGKGVDTLRLNLSARSTDNTVHSFNFSKVTGNSAADIGFLGIKAGQFEKVSASILDMDVGSVVTGSKGNDTINGYGKSGVINGGKGNDNLHAFGFNLENPANGIVVNGGAGDDKLSGSGDVTLIGGKGDDQFILTQGSASTIADFYGKDDVFFIRANNFTYYDSNLQKTVSATFDPTNPLIVGTDPKATSALAQFLYDTDDGKLYVDADGLGVNSDLELVATLANKVSLKAADFVFVI
ncbi:Ca2+-binding RTX toxin-like protein [Microvirga flocculans]|uniref:Ca2+-binding RTX toxin-like protein n=1 Tax=Microvirga flocculans TaxID=217168 RepID=A0A7W6IDV7_9HYPH|nr:calcium-binding protein [Microvirga flocculans]MBB4039667.1 Ca2+-binding RTX toxin-like protein [Microvirga flocculans]